MARTQTGTDAATRTHPREQCTCVTNTREHYSQCVAHHYSKIKQGGSAAADVTRSDPLKRKSAQLMPGYISGNNNRLKDWQNSIQIH